MADRRRGRTPAPEDDLPVEDVIRIQGDVPPGSQDAVLTPDELEHEREPTRTELDHGEPSPDLAAVHDQAEVLDGLDLDDLREGETDDPDAATEEGLAYVPPIDPPMIVDPEADDGVVMAAGIDVAADSEPYDEDHRSTDLDPGSELNTRIHAALRADAGTSRLADGLVIGTRGSIAVVRGTVDDIEDSDVIAEVVARVRGITDVVDQTELAS